MAAPGVDAIFLQLDAVVLPGYSRLLVRVAAISAWWSGAVPGRPGASGGKSVLFLTMYA